MFFFDYTSIASGDFEQIIIGNIKNRAHFLVILTPTALDRCSEPGDWLRRKVETAIDLKRNIIPLFFSNFRFGHPFTKEKLTGKLRYLNKYNGLNVHEDYFDEAMERLSTKFLNVPLNMVLQPVSPEVQKAVMTDQVAANNALAGGKENLKDRSKHQGNETVTTFDIFRAEKVSEQMMKVNWWMTSRLISLPSCP